MYEIEESEIDECPVSYISPWAAELVGSLEVARQVREAIGENPLPPANRWPVRLLDAARLVNVESIKEEGARNLKEFEERDT